VSIGTVTADPGGAWTFNTATLLTGNHNFTATATDAAGNISSLSNTLHVLEAPTVNVTVVSSTGIDLSGLYSDLGGTGTVGTHDSTHFQITNTNSNFNHIFNFVGTGFTYDGSNNPTAGTITEIDILSNPSGSTLLTETGFSISATAFWSALTSVKASSPGSMNTIFNGYSYAVTGSGGNDFIPLFTQADTFSGGNGNDLADYSHFPTPVTVDLSNFANNTGNATGDSYTSVEGVRGTSGNDHLIGNSGGNFLEGGAGADVLDGGPAGPAGTLDFASYFYAGAFGDTPASTGITADLADPSHNTGDAAGDANDNYLRGRGGADTLNGNGGSDTADYAGSAGLTVDFSNTANNTGDAVGDIYNGISNIRGSSNNDILRGDANNNVLTGGAGADTLTGNAGNDTRWPPRSTRSPTSRRAVTHFRSGTRWPDLAPRALPREPATWSTT
jgi:hypothetical protein